MRFQIKALSPEPFRELFMLDDAALAARRARRVIADAKPGFPCRVSLRDADIGEALILFHFAHLDRASPYASSHAIFVRENAEQAMPEVDEIPALLATRLLSVRVFDRNAMMLGADVVPGTALKKALLEAFSDEATEFVDIHNAKPGCFAARAVRAV